MADPIPVRLGLTMRVVNAPTYREPRDALAQDWPLFMERVLPEIHWVPVPNIRERVEAFAEYWQLGGFILTGGNDLGSAPERDATEMAVLNFARAHRLPVLGVCRGLQLMCHARGQPITPCPSGGHSATVHTVRLSDKMFDWEGDVAMVNSYHDQCVGGVENFVGPLAPFAISADGLVEGAYSPDARQMGIMWHPERENVAADFDAHIVRAFFDV